MPFGRLGLSAKIWSPVAGLAIRRITQVIAEIGEMAGRVNITGLGLDLLSTVKAA